MWCPVERSWRHGVAILLWPAPGTGQPATDAELYRDACAARHGGDAFSGAGIYSILRHVRTFCSNDDWPRALAELAADGEAHHAAALRPALGKTWTSGEFGRAWTPMMEVLAVRDVEPGASMHVDLVPQPEAAAAPIASALGEPREGLSRHAFRGGNAFMLRLLAACRDELRMTAMQADGSIAGNDNDVEPLAFEPHYTEIAAPDQVQREQSHGYRTRTVSRCGIGGGGR